MQLTAYSTELQPSPAGLRAVGRLDHTGGDAGIEAHEINDLLERRLTARAIRNQ